MNATNATLPAPTAEPGNGCQEASDQINIGGRPEPIPLNTTSGSGPVSNFKINSTDVRSATEEEILQGKPISFSSCSY
jgi:hypothetical protein